MCGFYPILFSAFRILKEGTPGIGWGKEWKKANQEPNFKPR